MSYLFANHESSSSIDQTRHTWLAEIEMSVAVLLAEQMPWVIRELLGPKSITTLYGKPHTQLRKVLNPSFTSKALVSRVPRLVEMAKEPCAELADAGKAKGEDAMKKFAFKVVRALAAQMHAVTWACVSAAVKSGTVVTAAGCPANDTLLLCCCCCCCCCDQGARPSGSRVYLSIVMMHLADKTDGHACICSSLHAWSDRK